MLRQDPPIPHPGDGALLQLLKRGGVQCVRYSECDDSGSTEYEIPVGTLFISDESLSFNSRLEIARV